VAGHVITLLWLYISRNFAKMWAGMSEPLATLLAIYFRGHGSRPPSMLLLAARRSGEVAARPGIDYFSLYYLIAAEQADEKSTGSSTLTVEHLRSGINLPRHISLFSDLVGAIDAISLARSGSASSRISYSEPVMHGFNFKVPELVRDQSCIVLDVPVVLCGMSPRTADDKLLAWVKRGFRFSV